MAGSSRRSSGSVSIFWVALLIAVLVHVVSMMVVGVLGLISFVPATIEQEIVMVPMESPEEPGLPTPPPPKIAPEPLPQPVPSKSKPRAKPPEPAVPSAPTPPLQEPSSTIAEQTVNPDPSPRSQEERAKINLNMTWNQFNRAFANEAAQARETHVETSLARRRQTGMFGGLSAKVKRALHSNSGWAKPGNQEPLGKRREIFYRYIKMIHEERIHPIFGHGFWESLSSLGSAHELNDMSLHALAEFEILENGAVNEVRVVRTSGNAVFDAAAVDSVYRGSPFPPPPKEILSWNGRVYLKWGFYRSRRMCGVFNVEPYILKAPGQKEGVQIDDFIRGSNSPG